MKCEAAHFMEPLLSEQDSRMNLKKSRFMYYEDSELPVDLKEAIKKAGLKFVNRESTMEGEERSLKLSLP
jgi:hypothetical protein